MYGICGQGKQLIVSHFISSKSIGHLAFFAGFMILLIIRGNHAYGVCKFLQVYFPWEFPTNNQHGHLIWMEMPIVIG